MTEKDLLDSLRFVDDDLIEEAGLEQLKDCLLYTSTLPTT